MKYGFGEETGFQKNISCRPGYLPWRDVYRIPPAARFASATISIPARFLFVVSQKKITRIKQLFIYILTTVISTFTIIL